MVTSALLSAIHLLTLALGLGAVFLRRRALAAPLDEAGWRTGEDGLRSRAGRKAVVVRSTGLSTSRHPASRIPPVTKTWRALSIVAP